MVADRLPVWNCSEDNTDLIMAVILQGRWALMWSNNVMLCRVLAWSWVAFCFVSVLSLFVAVFRQELGVHGSFTKIDEFSLEMITFDSDLLSMEMEYSFRVRSVLRSH